MRGPIGPYGVGAPTARAAIERWPPCSPRRFTTKITKITKITKPFFGHWPGYGQVRHQRKTQRHEAAAGSFDIQQRINGSRATLCVALAAGELSRE